MNFWGFTPEIFLALEHEFKKFLNTADQNNSEFHLPGALDRIITAKQAKVSVLSSLDRWVGITYMEDKDSVRLHLKELTEQGVYPATL